MFSAFPISSAPLATGPGRQLVASVAVAGGGALAGGLARGLVAAVSLAGGGALAVGLGRGLVTGAALAGGGALLATLVPEIISRADSGRRTRGGGGGDRGRVAGTIRLRFPNFDGVNERTRGGG